MDRVEYYLAKKKKNKSRQWLIYTILKLSDSRKLYLTVWTSYLNLSSVTTRLFVDSSTHYTQIIIT